MGKAAVKKHARLDVWSRAQIVAFARAGWAKTKIRGQVRKPNGAKPTLRTVQGVVAKATKDPTWRGQRQWSGGRPKTLTPAQQKEVVDLVFAERASAVVSIRYCKKKIPSLRKVSRWTIGRSLQDAGLAWLRRCLKRWVPPSARQQRKRHAWWLNRQARSLFRRFVYIDGTTFYLARGVDEADNKRRGRLGRLAWRMANGKDGLHSDNVGPSMYAASQGKPVKVWGVLANGRFSYCVLPADGARTTHMNGRRYRSMLKTKAKKWLRHSYGRRVPSTLHLVKDGETCLWTDDALKAECAVGLQTFRRHPKYSPDLNAIEGFWGRLRQLLDDRAPEAAETRADFLVRLRRTVQWMHDNLAAEMMGMCTNQHERADAVLNLEGARTEF